MKRVSIFTLIVALFIFAACQSGDPYNPDVLPANYDYAAGATPHSVILNGVTIKVENAHIVPGDANLIAGYVYVIMTIEVFNQSDKSVSATEFRLIDRYLNVYESWQTNGPANQSLTPMPKVIGPGQTTQGEHVFILPTPVLQADLRLRWESPVHESRIDLSLGPLSSGQ
ncbi:MAG: hypothetical protein GY796_33220 [Chloroflexi bacterium]|nr:hypothetical protein [Chloroflexota bacterium]